MKIFHIIPNLGVGGTEKMLFELCNGLDRARFKNEVFALKSGGSTAEDLRKIGVSVTQLKSPDGFFSGALDFPRLYVALRAALLMRNPDVVHTWLSRANVAGRLAARGAGMAHVVSSLRVMEKEKSYHLIAERLTQKFCDAVTVNCTPLKDFAVREIGFPEQKVRVIFNGIRPPEGSFGDRRSDPLLVGTMGRLHQQKGFDIFIKAVPLVLKKFPQCKFEIAGEGQEKENLISLSKQLGVSEKIRFAGLAPSVQFMSNLDVFVLASRWEGMPNVVLEAMALGKPVAASRVGGVTDLIEDGKEGVIFEPENPGACAAAVCNLIGDPNLKHQVSVQAKKKISEKFTMEKMISAHAELYESLVSRA